MGNHPAAPSFSFTHSVPDSSRRKPLRDGPNHANHRPIIDQLIRRSTSQQSFCQSNRTHARARNRIGCSSTLSSVIGRRRAPTGTNRPFRSRFGAVLDARVILNAGGLHFPILLSSPTNSPHRTPGTAFLSRIARGSITQGIFCNPQLPMSILKRK